MNDRRRHSAEKGSHAVSMGTAKAETGDASRAAPRLYLVTPPVADPDAVASDLADALNATDIAAVLLRLADGDADTQLARIKALRILIQSNGAALLLDGHAGLAARAEVDGARNRDERTSELRRVHRDAAAVTAPPQPPPNRVLQASGRRPVVRSGAAALVALAPDPVVPGNGLTDNF